MHPCHLQTLTVPQALSGEPGMRKEPMLPSPGGHRKWVTSEFLGCI